MSARRGAQFVPIGIPIICWKTFPAKTTKCKDLDDIIVRVLVFGVKRDDFNFHITNFPFLSSNIQSSPAYGVFISQLIRYARACSSYECSFWGPGDIPVSYSNRDTSWNAWNRHSGSLMVDTWCEKVRLFSLLSSHKINRIKYQCWIQTDKSQSRVIRCHKYQSRR